jgi:hypothetical protein
MKSRHHRVRRTRKVYSFKLVDKAFWEIQAVDSTHLPCNRQRYNAPKERFFATLD